MVAMVNYGMQPPMDSFLGTAKGLQGLDQSRAQEQRAQQNQQFKVEDREKADERESLLVDASDLILNGTSDEVATFALKHPTVMGDIIKMGEYRDKTTLEQRTNYLKDMLSGSVDPVQAATARADMIDSRGGDSSLIREAIQGGNEAIIEAAKKEYSVIAPDMYQKTYGSQGKPMTEYQKRSVELRQEDLAIKKGQAKTAKDKKVREANTARVEDEASLGGAYQALNDTLKLTDAISSHAGFSSYVGAKGISSAFGAFDTPVAGTDAAGVAGLVETLSSQNFLNSVEQMKGMGALSENEGKKLAAAMSSLDPNMSESEFKRSLNVIRTLTKRGMAKAQKIMKSKGYATPELEAGDYGTGDLKEDVSVFRESPTPTAQPKTAYEGAANVNQLGNVFKSTGGVSFTVKGK